MFGLLFQSMTKNRKRHFFLSSGRCISMPLDDIKNNDKPALFFFIESIKYSSTVNAVYIFDDFFFSPFTFMVQILFNVEIWFELLNISEKKMFWCNNSVKFNLHDLLHDNIFVCVKYLDINWFDLLY